MFSDFLINVLRVSVVLCGILAIAFTVSCLVYAVVYLDWWITVPAIVLLAAAVLTFLDYN